VEHDGVFVGWVGLGRRDPSRPGSEHPDLELSYVTPRSAWGHGFATEAAAAVLAWGDAVLGEPVVLCTQTTNARSLALAGRLGFSEVGRLEEFGAEQWIGVRHPGVRRATPADATSMARVAEAAYSPYLERMGGQRPGPLDADYAAAVTGTEAWVVERAGEVVGFLLLQPEDDALLLDNVAVLPAHPGPGIGRALLTLAEGRAWAHGLDRVRLYTHVTMVENQKLYERLGYVETHRGGDGGLVRVFYEKSNAASRNVEDFT